MQRLKAMRWMLALPILLGLGLSPVQGAPTEELEKLKVESGMPFGEAAGLASSNGEAVPAGPAGSTRPGLAKADIGANSGKPFEAPSGIREGVPAPEGRSPSGKNHTPSKKGLGRWAAMALLGMTAVLVLVGCGKSLQDYSPAQASDLAAKAVRVTNEAAFKTDGAVQQAQGVANRHFGPGELSGGGGTYTYWNSETGQYVHVNSTSQSAYELAVQQVTYAIQKAEANVRKASNKVNEAAMVAAKSGPEAQQALATARQSVLASQTALFQAKESIRVGPNSNEAKAAAEKAVKLSEEAVKLAGQAQEQAFNIAIRNN